MKIARTLTPTSNYLLTDTKEKSDTSVGPKVSDNIEEKSKLLGLRLCSLSEKEKNEELETIRQTNPDLYVLLLKKIEECRISRF